MRRWRKKEHAAEATAVSSEMAAVMVRKSGVSATRPREHGWSDAEALARGGERAVYGGDHEDAEGEERGVGEDEVVWAEAAGEEVRDGGGLERHDRELLRDRGGVQDDAGQTAGGDAAVQHETLEEGVVGVVIGEGLTPGGDGSGPGGTRGR